MPPDDTADRAADSPFPPAGDWPPADESSEYPVLYPEAIPVEPEPLVVYPEPDPEPLVVHPEPDPDPVFCRRCGETSVPEKNCCPWCGAWMVGTRPKARLVAARRRYDDEPEEDWDERPRRRSRRRELRPLIPPLVVVFAGYGLLLVTLVGSAIAAAVLGLTGDDVYQGMALSGVATAGLTVGALALVWREARQRVPEGTAVLTWAVAFPVLALLLCLNITYITFLRELLRPLGTPQGMSIQVTWVTVLLICAQPAIFEELFFRQMVLGVFRRRMNLHVAIWTTGAMFALAHLGNPLGMPYLFLAGAAFGYARAYGGLSLAMLLHFVHNFAVIAYEAWK
jgi:membrane protease YdiL (CAAX protease family)